jgi:hypothetical protein
MHLLPVSNSSYSRESSQFDPPKDVIAIKDESKMPKHICHILDIFKGIKKKEFPNSS